MRTRFFGVLLVVVTVITHTSVAQNLIKNMSSTNGDVYAVYKKGSSYYIGGSFTYVGLNTGYAALTKTNNDYPNMDFPQFNGQVYALIPDGGGGWFAGGNFTVVGGVSKSYLAHIKSNNTVDASFNANCNSQVRAMVKVGSRLYIGGSFTTVNGSTRLYAAAVNSSTGALVNAWNPAPNSTVNTITAAFGTDTTIWLGGYFTTINNNNRSQPYLAKVNSTNGAFVSGSFSSDSYVFKVKAKGDSVFVAGQFSRLGLKTEYLSAITEGANESDQSMPEANGQIRCIIPDGNNGWYVGGYFTQIGGVNKSYAAHILANKTVDPGFNANCNSVVLSMVKDGSKLYLGGAFTSVNGTPRNYLAAVNAASGALTSWDPSPNNQVNTLALNSESVLAGGYFTMIKGKNALRFAALSKTDGTPVGGLPGYNNVLYKVSVRGDSVLTAGAYTRSAYYSPNAAMVTTTNITPDPRFPSTNGIIYCVVKDASGNYYVGGSFTNIGGVNQAYIAKLNSSFQVISGWSPAVNNQVRAMTLVGSTLYIGGLFNSTNGVSRPYISALSTDNPGSNKTWNSSLNSYVYTLIADGTSLYVGGQFTLVNGVTTRNRLAKFNTNGALDASWNPNASGGGNTVEKLAVSGSNILAAGSFTTMGGVARNYLAKLNKTNGGSTNWTTANSYVYALFVDGTTCYVGGYFTSLTSSSSVTARSYLGAINISNGSVNAFNPKPNSYVFAIDKNGSNLYYGGYFTSINGTARNYVAASNVSTNALQTWDPSANSYVYSLTIDAAKNVFLGGNFSGFQEVTRTYASVVKYASKKLASWSPVINNVVYDITYGSKIVIGGAFSTVNGASKNGLAAFSLSGALSSTNLNLTKNGSTNVAVWSLYAAGNLIYAGGDFTQAGASKRNNFVEADLSSSAGTVKPTNPFADNIVYAISKQGNTIVYGGAFRYSNFTDRKYVAIIRNASGNVSAWNPLPDSYVYDITYNYNKVFIAGQFDAVNGASHAGAAAFSLSNGSLLGWNPKLSRSGQSYYADLNSVEADSNNVYLGGYFDQANGTIRNNAVAVSASNAALLPWNPGPNYIVRAMALNSVSLILGGDFTFCKGAARNYVARIDSASGLVNASWDPSPNGYVYALTGNANNIYIGGRFTTLGGVTRTSLGAVNAGTGVATSFNPLVQTNSSAGTVTALAFDAADVLYAGGSFNTAKGSTRNNLAAFTISSAGTLKSWNPNANATINALAVKGSTIYVGGEFTTLNGGTARNRLASVNNTNGNVLSFNPNLNSYVYALTISGNNLYAGGSFTTVKGGTTSRNYLAAFNTSTDAVTSWNPVPNSTVLGIASASDTVYAGGYFSTLNGVTRNRLGAVKGAAGTAALAFNPDMNSIVRANYTADHILLSGGNFSTVGGSYRGGFAVFALPHASLNKASDEALYVSSFKLDDLSAERFRVYPNPVTERMVTLQLDNMVKEKLAVSISTIDGKKVYQSSLDNPGKNHRLLVDVADLANGVYIVNVTGIKTHLTKEIVIQR